MVLPTTADLSLRSPIVSRPSAPESNFDGPVTLTDLTGLGLLQLRGSEPAVGEAVSAALPDAAADGGELADDLPATIGAVQVNRGRLLARLTDDEWLMVAPDPATQPTIRDSSALVTATDVSHGCGTALLAGASAAMVLPKLCGLDFSEEAFPNLHAAQTSLAKVRALIVRRDFRGRPAYLIAVGRSLAEYVWEQLLDAAREFEPRVVGGAGLAAELIGEVQE